MIVDDEELLCKIFRRGLQRLGYQVEAFQDSEEALEKFRQAPENYDLVITDLVMPNLRGDKLSEALTRVRPGLPVILCSGYLSEFDKTSLHESGIVDYIEKPVFVTDLHKLIRKTLSNT